MTQTNNERDLILDDAVAAGADIIGAGERIDQAYEGVRTLYKHFLFSENELLAFLKLHDARAQSPISQNEQPKQIPDGWKLVPINHLQEIVNLCNQYKKSCANTGYLHLAKDLVKLAEITQSSINASPTTSLTSETNTEVGND